MMDKNEFYFRNRCASVMTACVMLCLALLDGFGGTNFIGWSFDHKWAFWVAPAIFWIIAPYFRNYFDDFQSSGYTPLIDKNELYFRILFVAVIGVCFLLCLLLLDKFAGTSLMVWLFDNLWIFGVIAGSSWVISPYLRNYFGIFQSPCDEQP
ncbi:MAG: hypothetical protein IJR28_08085 [Ottowia sp.]|nr:hypothetical protein [Ottowia sp.]